MVGVDPYLLEADAWRDLVRELQGGGHSLIPVSENLIDLIWMDRPLRPAECVVPLEVRKGYAELMLYVIKGIIISRPCILSFYCFSSLPYTI